LVRCLQVKGAPIHTSKRLQLEFHRNLTQTSTLMAHGGHREFVLVLAIANPIAFVFHSIKQVVVLHRAGACCWWWPSWLSLINRGERWHSVRSRDAWVLDT